jgi:hypothetical protein
MSRPSRLAGATAATDRTLGVPSAIYFLGDSKITDRAPANPHWAYARAGLRRASCSARALSTSKVSVPATAMADKLITS